MSFRARLGHTGVGPPPAAAAVVAWLLTVSVAASHTHVSAQIHGHLSTPKSSVRVLLLLGLGCTSEQVDTELEERCTAAMLQSTLMWRMKAPAWKQAGPDCKTLPALNDKDPADKAWGFQCDYKQAYSMVFRRALPNLRSLGWRTLDVATFGSSDMEMLAPAADVLIVPLIEYLADVRDRYPDKRFIIIHTDDSATINPQIDINDPQILGLLMHTSFWDKMENNLPSPHGRRHSAWMLPSDRIHVSDSTTLVRDPPFERSLLNAKVQTIIPQIQRWIHPLDCGGNQAFSLFAGNAFGGNSSWAPKLRERPIDMAFVGELGEELVIHKAISSKTHIWLKESGRNKTGVRGHRLKAMNAMRQLAEKHNLNIVVAEEKLKYKEYVDLLLRSKIFISPFGLGEFSGKDYESVLAGAMLVKPLASRLRSYPNIYSSECVLETAGDFSDLEEVVMPYLSDPEMLKAGQRMVSSGQRKLRRHKDVTTFAKDFSAMLEKLLEPHMQDFTTKQTLSTRTHVRYTGTQGKGCMLFGIKFC